MPKVKIHIEKDCFGNIKNSSVGIPEEANVQLHEVTVSTEANGFVDLDMRMTIPKSDFDWVSTQEISIEDQIAVELNQLRLSDRDKVLAYIKGLKGAV